MHDSMRTQVQQPLLCLSELNSSKFTHSKFYRLNKTIRYSFDKTPVKE